MSQGQPLRNKERHRPSSPPVRAEIPPRVVNTHVTGTGTKRAMKNSSMVLNVDFLEEGERCRSKSTFSPPSGICPPPPSRASLLSVGVERTAQFPARVLPASNYAGSGQFMSKRATPLVERCRANETRVMQVDCREVRPLAKQRHITPVYSPTNTKVRENWAREDCGPSKMIKSSSRATSKAVRIDTNDNSKLKVAKNGRPGIFPHIAEASPAQSKHTRVIPSGTVTLPLIKTGQQNAVKYSELKGELVNKRTIPTEQEGQRHVLPAIGKHTKQSEGRAGVQPINPAEASTGRMQKAINALKTGKYSSKNEGLSPEKSTCQKSRHLDAVRSCVSKSFRTQVASVIQVDMGRGCVKKPVDVQDQKIKPTPSNAAVETLERKSPRFHRKVSKKTDKTIVAGEKLRRNKSNIRKDSVGDYSEKIPLEANSLETSDDCLFLSGPILPKHLTTLQKWVIDQRYILVTTGYETMDPDHLLN